jgi:hypothetical protein
MAAPGPGPIPKPAPEKAGATVGFRLDSLQLNYSLSSKDILHGAAVNCPLCGADQPC